MAKPVATPLVGEGSDKEKHDVFLSSAWHGLDKTRAKVADWLEGQGYDAFVFERYKTQSEWEALLPAACEAICLENVAKSSLYIGIFHSEYGGSANKHVADIAFTDLELFEAFRTGKPMRLFFLGGTPPDRKLTALLTVIETVFPAALVKATTEAQLIDRIKSEVELHFDRSKAIKLKPSLFKRYCHVLIARRKPDDDRNEGLRFLLDQYPSPKLAFDPDLVTEELAQLQNLASYEARLNGAYHVLHRLFQVPWMKNHNYLHLWDDTLAFWDRTAAWLGLHGFTYAGRLSAANTLVAIRALAASSGEIATLSEILRKGETRTGTREEWIKLYSTGGALASEYYSIAKQAPRALRVHYLSKADQWISVAERAFERKSAQTQAPGLASIRGHIYLEWGRVSEALPLFERSLKLRTEAGSGAASIGEARVDLGFAYVRAGKRRRGAKLVEDGLAELELYSKPGFLARAKRKAVYVFARNGAFQKSLGELADLKHLVETHDLHGQRSQMGLFSYVPDFILERFRTEESYPK